MRIKRLLYIASAMLILGGCVANREEGRDAIAVSFEPQAWLASQLMGDSTEIITLLPSGIDPETYQPSISTMKALGNASVYFTLGTEGFEQSLSENISKNFPGLRIADSSEKVDKIYGSHGNVYDEGHPHNFDPHILASIKNCIKIAESMEATLITTYPERATSIKANGEKLRKRLAWLDDSLRRMNLTGKPIVIRHPSLEYFARDYGLKQIALNEAGKETSPLQMKQRIDEARRLKPAVMIVEKEHEYSSDYATAQQIGLDTIRVSLNSSAWLDDLIRISHEINHEINRD